VPDRVRALVRGSEVWLVFLAAGAGALAGIIVVLLSAASQGLHELLFHLQPGDRLSAVDVLPDQTGYLVPAIGGLALAVFGILLARTHSRRAVDPIEANALHGGRMSLRDSIVVAAQILISNGFGASVGLEAGYTQAAAGLASRIGIAFNLRRGDLRVLVGAGAAAAIASAFGAPLTGAFYAFELIIGTYAVASVAPVLVAAIAGVLVSRAFGAVPYSISVGALTTVKSSDLPALLVLALCCALVGIVVMRGVTLTELAFRRSRVPPLLHAAFVALAVGGLALITPHILSSGHEEMRIGLRSMEAEIWPLATLLVLKALASAISLGAGFRGGLFFASLLLGAVAGRLFAAVVALVSVSAAPDPLVSAIIGMSATAVAIVGGPLTMSFLALETTGNVSLTLAVLAAAALSAMVARTLFGYSFATWRLHLRGETIRSAHDVGRIRALVVGRLMRRDVRTVRSDTRLSAFRRDFPLGSTQRVVIVDGADQYAGVALVAEVHALELAGELDTRTIGEFLHYAQQVLEPQMNIKDAMKMFDAAESEALAVIDGPATRKVIGLLTEGHALRRYAEELDRARRDLVGEGA
jgi:CIC family chloride channel protein